MPGAKVLSLPEALERELAVVHETSNVNTLEVENKSDEYELFIQSGDIVKGGKQDRMAQMDMLLPPKSGVVPLPAHCVEQGRWTGRGSEDSRAFKSSTKCAVGNEMKIANLSGQQSAVWETVGYNQAKLNDNLKANVNASASPTSFQLSLESPELLAKVAEYETALKAAGEERDSIIGVVFAVNGNVTGAEVYGSNAIFRKAWPKLLNSAAVEALRERTDKPLAAAPSTREIERFLARAAEPTPVKGTINTTNNYEVLFFENLPSIPPNTATLIPAASQIRARGISTNANEVFQTDGQQLIQQTAGRDQQAGEPAVYLPPSPIPAQPAPNPPPQQAGVAGTFVSGEAAPAAAQSPDRAGRILIEGNERTGNQVILNQVDLRPGQPSAQPTANANGNRLNMNVNVNPSSLMVESRDPARQNVIIHRSYLRR
jgi:hypothetical protein